MENGYLSTDYPIERYLSYERSGEKNRRGHVWEVSDFSPVSAARQTWYHKIKPSARLVKTPRG